nr:MAG TPA: hypothetical protein [Caudoviricetes sp.]DAT85356.1 MAG TPA: hypothetical protein [Caudoviricetes sp.]
MPNVRYWLLFYLLFYLQWGIFEINIKRLWGLQ